MAKKMIDALLRKASEEAKASAKLTDFRYRLLTQFLESAEAEWGLGPDKFSSYLKDSIDLAKQKSDLKTMEKLLNMWYTLMYAPDSNVKNLISSAQTLLKLEPKPSPGQVVNAEPEEKEESDEDKLEFIEAQLAEHD